MAEQLCVGALICYTQTGVVDLARDEMIDVDDGGIDLELWVEEYLADVDHELLYDTVLDGIDDDTTDHQYGFGRMDYEGIFVVFNEHHETSTGAPHPARAAKCPRARALAIAPAPMRDDLLDGVRINMVIDPAVRAATADSSQRHHQQLRRWLATSATVVELGSFARSLAAGDICFAGGTRNNAAYDNSSGLCLKRLTTRILTTGKE